MSRLLAFHRRYGHQLPLALKAITQLRCRVALIRGRLHCGTTVMLLYAGRDRSRSWLLQQVFADWEEEVGIDCNLLDFRAAARRLADRSDVQVLDFGWPYDVFARNGRPYLQVPAWLSMRMPLPRDWEALPRRFAPTLRRKELRQIERAGLRGEVTQDVQQVRDFYDAIYLPAMRGRHGDGAVIVPLSLMLKRARRGWLLRVMQGDQVAAGGVFYPEGETCFFLWMGVSPEHPVEGAATAVYYFGLRQAWERGLREVDFGGTRALLNDGALRFKRKWGATVEDTFDPGAIQVAPRTGSDAAVAFCAALPALVRGDRGLQAWFVAEPGAGAAAARLHTLARETGLRDLGITRASLLALASQDSRQPAPPDPSGCEYALLGTQPGHFAEHYVQQGESLNAIAGQVATGSAADLIDWPPGQQLPGIVGCRHRLLDTGLFSDEGLLDVFDRHNPDELLVYRMGEDHHNLDDFQKGSRGALNAQQLLDAVKAGRLWLNIIHISKLPAYRDLVERIYDELERKVEGFRAVVRSANLLVSSPGAKVYYHADAPLNMLWHLRGEKRIWIYPDGEKYAPREWVEMLYTRESDDDLPYRPEFDRDATAHPLLPGHMLTWPQNRPHRVENVQGLCVSLTTEHYTPEAMKKRMTYLANRYLREWLHLPTTGTALDGPAAVAKRALFRVARNLPWFHEVPAEGDTAKFTLDR